MRSDVSLEGVPGRDFSALSTLETSLRFLINNGAKLVFSAWLPLVAATVVLYVTFQGYFTWLVTYLRDRDLRAGSFALSVATLGIVILSLLAVNISARTALFATQGVAPPWLDGALLRVSSKLFAAALRALLILFMAIFSLTAIDQFLNAMLPPSLEWPLRAGLWFSAAIAIAGFAARGVFLLPALAAYEHNAELRRSWTISGGHVISLLTVWVTLGLVPAAIFELVGEAAVQFLGNVPVHAGLADATAALTNQGALVAMTLAFALATVFGTISATVGSCFAYAALSKEMGDRVA